MLHMMMYTMMFISGLIFSQMNHPMAMGLMLLIQTILICMMTGLMSKTFWFSYVLFLIFLGGMLVLFIYVTSLASNEMFSTSMPLISISYIIMMFMTVLMLKLDPTYIHSYIENNEMNNMSNLLSFTKENSIMLNKMYNFPTNMITMMLIMYLLMALIVMVKITNVFYGPLRKMT